MNRPEKLLHALFFSIALIWLGVSIFYQVFINFGDADLKHLRYRAPDFVDPITTVDEKQIQVVCNPICYFLTDGKQVRSRTDSDAGGGLLKVTLRFYDAYHGLIGYEDDQPNPNFLVIDTNGEFLQVVRLKLPRISFSFAAYYPSVQLIQFKADNGRQYFYSANKPELKIL